MKGILCNSHLRLSSNRYYLRPSTSHHMNTNSDVSKIRPKCRLNLQSVLQLESLLANMVHTLQVILRKHPKRQSMPDKQTYQSARSLKRQ
jgi:hypothetical protein